MLNKNLIQQRFKKAINSYNDEAKIQLQIAEKMIRLLQNQVNKPVNNILEIGCGTGTFTNLLNKYLHAKNIFANDICPDMESCFENAATNIHFIVGDAENTEFPLEQDLVCSCSALQWFANTEAFLKKTASLLKKDGLLAISTFGPNNMNEIAVLTGKTLHYPSLSELKDFLIPEYDILHAEEEIIQIQFDTAMNVLYHIKNTGVSGITQNTWTKSSLTAFKKKYVELFGNKNSVTLTYHPIYLIARKKIKNE